jgi:hypothetical protein
MGAWIYLPMASLPLGILMTVLVWRRSGTELNPVLGGTAGLYVVYTVMMAVALVLSHGFGA